MKIKTIKSQHRRDFFAIYKCEFCGEEHEGPGYDDSNFHQNVIPDMKCGNPDCGKRSNDQPEFKPVEVAPTRYPDWMQV